MGKLQIRNPYSGELLSELTFAKPAEISSAVQTSFAAFQKWRRSSAWEKSQLLSQVAVQLEAQREEFAQLICEEAGKPIQLARAEVERAIGVLRWTLELGGNAWVMILEDTPASAFPAIAQKISAAAFGYAGQSCISVQNVAVASEIWGHFQNHMKTATQKTPFGDPSLVSVVSGPVIHEKAADRIRAQLQARPDQAELVSSIQREVGQSQANGDQGMIAPTLVLMHSEAELVPRFQMPPLIPLVQEEIFGPVMTESKFLALSFLILP